MPSLDRSNPSRMRLEEFIESCSSRLDDDSLILDAGAGDQRYSKFFGDHRYEAADFCKVEKPYAKQNYVCSLESIPVEDNRFDAVLLSQVLEHIPEPEAVLRELMRVLKPGGVLWLTTPLFFPEHEQPYDFFRYTQFGLKHLVEKAGLNVESVEWLEGYSATLGYQLHFAVRRTPISPAAYGGGPIGLVAAGVGALSRVNFFLLGKWFYWMETRHKHVGSGMPKNYALIARKPVKNL